MIQIQAYNQSTDSQVYLDLLDIPDIQVNYSFADIKDPSSRNSDYSQTFKLPFTNTNNQFFEQLFEVNISTATFNPQIKTDAIILVNGVNVHKGFLQIKNILTKSKLYEVVVFGEAADLCTSVKDKNLIEGVRDPTTELLKTDYNHLLTVANVQLSWTGVLENIDEEVVPDILYPIIDWGIQKANEENYPFYAIENSSIGLGLTASSFIAAINTEQHFLRPHYLKPAIKLKTLLQEILQNNGFSYTSTFIDSDYFGKLYFQLGTEFEKVITKPVGGIKVGFAGDHTLQDNVYFPLNFINDSSSDGFYDVDGMWGVGPVFSGNVFIPTTPGIYKFKLKLVLGNTEASADMVHVDVTMSKSDSSSNFTTLETPHSMVEVPGSASADLTVEFEFEGVDVIVGDFVWWSVEVSGMITTDNITLTSGADGCNLELLGINYTGEGTEVYIPDNCPDIEITDFLKDLFQRFNLVLVPEKDNPKN